MVSIEPRVKVGHKVECIERLLEKNHSYEEICEWLILNKFTDAITAKQNTRTKEKAEFIYGIFKKEQADDNIILLYFEWSILPTESIKITCVTSKEEKFFTYGI